MVANTEWMSTFKVSSNCLLASWYGSKIFSYTDAYGFQSITLEALLDQTAIKNWWAWWQLEDHSPSILVPSAVCYHLHTFIEPCVCSFISWKAFVLEQPEALNLFESTWERILMIIFQRLQSPWGLALTCIDWSWWSCLCENM